MSFVATIGRNRSAQLYRSSVCQFLHARCICLIDRAGFSCDVCAPLVSGHQQEETSTQRSGEDVNGLPPVQGQWRFACGGVVADGDSPVNARGPESPPAPESKLNRGRLESTNRCSTTGRHDSGPETETDGVYLTELYSVAGEPNWSMASGRRSTPHSPKVATSVLESVSSTVDVSVTPTSDEGSLAWRCPTGDASVRFRCSAQIRRQRSLTTTRPRTGTFSQH